MIIDIYAGYRDADKSGMFHIWRDRVAACGIRGLLFGKVPAKNVPEHLRCLKCKWPEGKDK